ncbi:DUF7673 family protein [Variovorax sp. JS1663]|uniref:DUF7673 family protein n=1 Tax=Variovorax sp. JS1663 TaxID=1851577 RepID=UPI000B34727E|nr:hypothetical protein [Variovorax sp. JS1663]OUM00112.1 hypothetical protein A8M77_23305 [Variovorax sp. JS1663]
MDRDIIETRGAAALQRLFAVANRDSGQCRYIARFLLGLYNGQRFPFDFTDLRAIDGDLFEDCVTVLRMDAQVSRQEVHKYFDDDKKFEALSKELGIGDIIDEGGSKLFEGLARRWGVEAAEKVRADAKRAAQPVGTPAPLHEGGTFDATLLTYGEAFGYRDVSVVARLGEGGNTEVRLRLTPSDSEALMQHITRVHAFAWRNAERGPLDKKPGEMRPAWLDRAPAQW